MIERRAFPDHHPYDETDLSSLVRAAEQAGALLVTTEKDAARIAAPWRAKIVAVPVTVTWTDEPALDALLARKLGLP
jgi:tetraacyldisaccharide 4'-kinase